MKIHTIKIFINYNELYNMLYLENAFPDYSAQDESWQVPRN